MYLLFEYKVFKTICEYENRSNKRIFYKAETLKHGGQCCRCERDTFRTRVGDHEKYDISQCIVRVALCFSWFLVNNENGLLGFRR